MFLVKALEGLLRRNNKGVIHQGQETVFIVEDAIHRRQYTMSRGISYSESTFLCQNQDFL